MSLREVEPILLVGTVFHIKTNQKKSTKSNLLLEAQGNLSLQVIRYLMVINGDAL